MVRAQRIVRLAFGVVLGLLLLVLAAPVAWPQTDSTDLTDIIIDPPDGGGLKPRCTLKIELPPDVTVCAEAPDYQSAIVDPGRAKAIGNCPPIQGAGVRSDGRRLRAPYHVGVTTITWMAHDHAGNQVSGVVKITVVRIDIHAVSLPPGRAPGPTGDITLCVGDTALVAASTTPGPGGSYSWTPAGDPRIGVAGMGATAQITALAPARGVAVTATDPTGCSRTLRVNIVRVVIAGPAEILVGATGRFTALTDEGGGPSLPPGPSPYEWTSSDTVNAPVDRYTGVVTGMGAADRVTIAARDTRNGCMAAVLLAVKPKWPAPPTPKIEEKADSLGASSITFVWSSDPKTQIDGYEYEREQVEPEGETADREVAFNRSAAGRRRPTVDSGLLSGTKYCYRLRVYQKMGDERCYSAWSNRVCFTTSGCALPAPTELTGSFRCADDTVRLSWAYGELPKECAGKKLQFFLEYRCVKASEDPDKVGAPWKPLTPNPVSGTSYSHERLADEEGRDCYYRVSAGLSDGSRSPWAATAKPVEVPPASPSGLRVYRLFPKRDATPNAARLNFTNNSQSAGTFEVYRKRLDEEWDDEDPSTQRIATQPLTKRPVQAYDDKDDTGLGTKWEYRVAVFAGKRRSCNYSYAGYAEVKKDTPLAMDQKTKVWCWAASLSMLCLAHDVEIPQENFVEYLRLKDRDYWLKTTLAGPMPSGPLKNFATALNLVNELPQRKRLDIVVEGVITEKEGLAKLEKQEALIDSIIKEKPFIYGYDGHATLCYGLTWRGQRPKARIVEVELNDPFYKFNRSGQNARYRSQSFEGDLKNQGLTQATVEWSEKKK